MIKELEQFAKDHPDFKVSWLKDLSDDRQDSNWYDGDVLNYIYKNRFQVCVFVTGDVKFTMKNNEHFYHLEDAGLKKDKDLRKIKFWINNNWYVLTIYDKKYKDGLYIDDPYIDNITDAIDLKFIQGLIDEYLRSVNL